MSSTDPKDARAAPLWSWNDLMEPAACAAQVESLAAAGFGGAYAHTRLGMLIPFLGEQYLACLKASVERAHRLGFRLNLYDEDRWPSGWAGGAVPLASKDYRVKALLRRPADEAAPPHCEQLLAHDGFHYYVWTMPLGHPKFSGTCYADLTNEAAVACFLKNAFDPLANALGQHFGGVIESIFSDEPALTYLYSWPTGGVPWSAQLPARLQVGSDEPLPAILAAVLEDRPSAPRLRLLYYRELAAQFDAAFMQQVAAWTRPRGIAWTGHFMYEHSLALHFSWGVNCHGSYRRFDWPGVDHLGRQVGEVVTALGCRSAVHQFSKPRMMSELFGASGQHLSFADRKWIAEQQMVLGANHLVPHVSSTSLAGARKRDYPPAISAHQPWWPLNHYLEDHCARVCATMARGQGVPDLLVIHPQETVMARSVGPVELGNQPTWETRFFCKSTDERLNAVDENWKELCHALLDSSYVFDFGDEGVLAECGSVDAEDSGYPRLRVGNTTYRAALIPDLETLRHSTVDLLTRFVERGGIVACVGGGPTLVDGDDRPTAVEPLTSLLDALRIRNNDVSETVRTLAATLPPLVQVLSHDSHSNRVWRYTRVDGDQRITMLANLDRFRRRTVDVRWTQSPPTDAFAWPTHSAESERLTLVGPTATLTLEPGSSTIIVENSPAGPPVAAPSGSSRRAPRDVACENLSWRVSRLDPNALVLDTASWRRPGDTWRGPYPVLAIKDFLDRTQYDGPIDLKYQLPRTESLPRNALLSAIFESDEDHPVAIVNGMAVATSASDELLQGRGFVKFDLSSARASARDSIILRISQFRHSDPARKLELDRRLGTPLESLILVGDFSVFGIASSGPQAWSGQIEYHTGDSLSRWLPEQPLRYLAAPWRLEAPAPLTAGDLTGQGLPFYAGRVRYEAELRLEEIPATRLRLVLNHLPAPAAEISINGSTAGAFAWAPYAVDISDLVHVGENHVTLTIHHSLRNLLGPHHHPAGEPVYVTPDSFRPIGGTQWLESLMEGKTPAAWRDDYCFVEFGLPTRH